MHTCRSSTPYQLLCFGYCGIVVSHKIFMLHFKMNNQDAKLIYCFGSVWPLQTFHTLLIQPLPADPVKSGVRVNLRPSGVG